MEAASIGGNPCVGTEQCCEAIDSCNDNCCSDGDCGVDEVCDAPMDVCRPTCTADADCDDGDPCNGTEFCNATVCDVNITDCNGNGNGIEDTYDLFDLGCAGGNLSEDCNGNGTPDECEGGPFPAELIASVPSAEGSLWRQGNNIVRLTFACDITPPAPGDVQIVELLADGNFGSDLSANFSFTVENDRVLRVLEPTSVLEHRKWYALLNTPTHGNWAGAACFEVQYVLQIGDADADKFVTPVDVSLINTNIGPAPDDSRFDIDGSGYVTPVDVSLANAHVSGFVAKPTGHGDNPCE